MTFYLEGFAVWLLGGFVVALVLGPVLEDEIE
jgi:hypothetical protein